MQKYEFVRDGTESTQGELAFIRSQMAEGWRAVREFVWNETLVVLLEKPDPPAAQAAGQGDPPDDHHRALSEGNPPVL